MKSFEELLGDYARVIVQSGVNLRPGQHLLLVGAPVEAVEAATAIATAAYRAGSRLFDPMWSSDSVTLTRFRNAPDDSFAEYPSWRTAGLNEAAKDGAAFVLATGSDPDLLRDENEEHVTAALKSAQRHMMHFTRERRYHYKRVQHARTVCHQHGRSDCHQQS